MINIHGDRMNKQNIVIADADIIISLYFSDDVNHQKVGNLITQAVSSLIVIKYPNTAILEAITTLRRALNKPEIAALVTKNI